MPSAGHFLLNLPQFPNAYTLISYPHQRFTMSNFLFVDGHSGGMKHPYMLTVKAQKLHLASGGL